MVENIFPVPIHAIKALFDLICERQKEKAMQGEEGELHLAVLTRLCGLSGPCRTEVSTAFVQPSISLR